jgi:hypothetical protein
MQAVNESPMVLSPKWFRKALMEERRVSASEVAAEAQVSEHIVRRVIRGPNKVDTRNVKHVKQIIARRTGRSVAELWPEDEPAGNNSTSRAEPGRTGGAR